MLTEITYFSKEIKKFLNKPIAFDDDPHDIRLSFIRRIDAGANSAKILLKKELYYDSHIITGSLIEALALLDYIVSENKIEEYYDFGTIVLIKKIFLSQIEEVKKIRITKKDLDYLKGILLNF